jgi:hypothetical protein
MNDRMVVRRRRTPAEAEEVKAVAARMAAKGVSLARVLDDRFADQLAITCCVCDWRGIATNAVLAQHQTELHINPARHLERLAQVVDPTS